MTLLKIAKAPTRCICVNFSFRLWKKESLMLLYLYLSRDWQQSLSSLPFHPKEKKVYSCSTLRGSERVEYRREGPIKRLYLHMNIFPQCQCKQIRTALCKNLSIVEEIYADCRVNAYYFKSVKLRLDKNNIINSVIFMTSYQAYETLQRCLNAYEVNCTIQFQTRMSSNEFLEVNIMALPDHSGFQVSWLNDRCESHRSVAQSCRLCNKQWEAN